MGASRAGGGGVNWVVWSKSVAIDWAWAADQWTTCCGAPQAHSVEHLMQ